MGRYSPSAGTVSLLIESKAISSQLSAQEKEYARILSRLGDSPVCSTTKAIFERYVSGTITAKELEDAIEEYLRQKDGSPTSSV